MTMPGGDRDPLRARSGHDAVKSNGANDATYACDLHLSRCSPVCDALGSLDWRWQIIWFHDFGLLPLDGGRQLRLGVAPPSGTMGQIKALTAAIVAPAAGVIATQEFPLAPYVNDDRDAATAIVLCNQGGAVRFVRGVGQTPVSAAERPRLATLCRAIETWAALLSGGALPNAAAPAEAGQHDQPEADMQEQLVVTDDLQEPSSGS
jgi:hypothetical protein